MELKSARGDVVRVTPTQAIKAVEYKSSFVLVVVPIGSEEITPKLVRNKSRFITNIGDLLEQKVQIVESYREQRTKAIGGIAGVEVAIEEGEIRYKIHDELWNRGQTFDEFVKFLENYFSN